MLIVLFLCHHYVKGCVYFTGFHLEKWARGGQNSTYEKHGGAKGVRAIARLLGGYGGILNLYP